MRDEAAFVEFAASSRAHLRRTAYLMCGDWERASDFVQEGLIRVYVRWPRLERNGGELAYARKAVVSACLDHARRRSSTERPQEADHSTPSREDVAAEVATRAALMSALADLAPRQRACVVLRYSPTDPHPETGSSGPRPPAPPCPASGARARRATSARSSADPRTVRPGRASAPGSAR